MIATIKTLGVLRGLIISLLMAVPIYGYQQLPFAWKPCSEEDYERWVRTDQVPDMGISTKDNECTSDWGSFAENTILRPKYATRSSLALRCDRIIGYDGSIFYGWTYVPNEP